MSATLDPATSAELDAALARLGSALAVRAERARWSRARIYDACDAAARRAFVVQTKASARRYDRDLDLACATGVYREFCAVMPRAEAIRRLTEAHARERAAYKAGAVGAITNACSSRILIITIRAALLCERLARRRDRAQAAMPLEAEAEAVA